MCFPASRKASLGLVLAVLGVGAIGVALRPEPVQAVSGIETVTVDDVAALLSDKRVHIYDANSARRFAQGHVPGAVHLPLDEINRSRLPADTAARLIFYCWNGICDSSHEAAERATSLGYTNVSVMSAGISGWTKAGKPMETTR